MLLELLGRPGAGKTYVYLSPELRPVWSTVTGNTGALGPNRSGRSVKPTGALRWRIRALWAHPAVGLLSYFAVATRRGVRPSNLKRVVLVQRAYGVLRNDRAPHTLVDEGPVHALFCAMHGTRETPVSKGVLLALLRVLARPVGRYLLLEIPVENCIWNCRNREAITSRFNAATTQAEMEVLHLDQVYDDLVTALRVAAPSKVMGVQSASEALTVLMDPAMFRPTPSIRSDRRV